MPEKSCCIIIDTNVWRQHLLLRTVIGSTFLYTITQTGHKLLVPEIIEKEIFVHTKKVVESAKNEIDKSFRIVGSVIGEHSAYDLPSGERIHEAIAARLKELEGLIVKAEFTFAHAKSALERVIEKIPPSSSKQQQFKDCAIWEAAMGLAERYNFIIVTNDGDFFANKNRTELHPILSDEAQQKSCEITVYSSLESCLDSLAQEMSEEELPDLANNIYQGIESEVERNAMELGVRPVGIRDFEIRRYITEVHNRLAVNYNLILDAINSDTGPLNQDSDATITVGGSCFYDVKHGSISKNDFDKISANWVDTNGRDVERVNIFMVGNMHIGGKPNVQHRVRRELK